MTRVILKGVIVVPVTELDLVKSELLIHTTLTLKEVGCLAFSVIPDQVNPYQFTVYEEFVNQAAFDHHQIRVKSSKWGKITKNVKRSYTVSSEK